LVIVLKKFLILFVDEKKFPQYEMMIVLEDIFYNGVVAKFLEKAIFPIVKNTL